MPRKEGYTTYIGAKDGCRVSASCQSCPLERCIYELSSVSVIETVRVLARAGVSDEAISQQSDVSVDTLRRWRRVGDIP